MSNSLPTNRLDARTEVSRRALLRTAGIGLGAVVLPPYLAGCTSQNEPDQNDRTPPTGGAVSIGQSEVNTSFDPAQTARGADVAVNKHIYQSLYRHSPFPPQTDLTPDLAIDFPEQVDETTYRLRLRDDVSFHDGRPLTADDVVFTFDHYMNPDQPSFLTRFFEPLFTRLTATGPGELEIILKAPTTLLAHRLGVLQIISQAAVADTPDIFETRPLGSGPYEVSEVVPGEALTIVKSSGYSGAGTYHLDQVNYTYAADAAARLAGLYSDRFDIIELPPESAFNELSTSEAVGIDAVPSNFSTFIFFNNSQPPFDDVRVRQAALYAIDRDAISETCFFGLAEPAWDGVIRPEDPDYAQPDLIYRHDPDQARALLSEAGFGGEPVPIDVHGMALEFVTAQLPIIQENLRDVGFEPQIRPADPRSPADVGADAFILVGGPDIFAPDAEFILRWLYYGVIPRQFAFLDDATATRIEDALDEAYQAPNDGLRRESLENAQRLIQELVPLAPLHRKMSITAWSNRVTGFQAPATTGIYLDGVSI
ncbi:ABC transporter substrate-binding protein [Phytoactinopolyspora limicola]|uniref:ABC transporter substrate-binding protein n=1 Tax=Phytoactinopolyspora limicola TaxID=2715536 RepID=UPI0014074AA8|nr:ABC transporter substrate-binding protein [Phytoactinopolyspora limicola]